jgi:hypothetical protein
MADASARKAAIQTAVSQVRSGNTFTRRAAASAAAGKVANSGATRAKKTG